MFHLRIKTLTPPLFFARTIMKLSLLLATSFLTAGIVFSHPMDMDDGNLEFSDVSRFISIANAPGPVAPPVVIPVDGTIKDLPNLGEKQLNIAEIARLDNKILSIPRAEGEEPLFLVIHDAKRYTHHYEDDEQNNTQVEGITFKFSLAMVDPRRVEKQFWDDVLDALSDEPDMPAAVDHKIHDPSSTWSHPLKSCFSAGWQPNKTVI